MADLKEQAYLKVQLAFFQQFQSQMGPIDLLPLQTLLEEEEGGGQSGAKQNFVDFLLPLPEHLQAREIGIADPVVVKQSKAERGMNTNIAQNNKEAAEKSLKNELKNQLKNRPNAPAPGKKGPAPKMKSSIRPHPFYGTTSSTAEED